MFGRLVTFGIALLSLGAMAETPQERGAYLVNTVAACGNCHTPFGPNGPDMSKALSGRLVTKEEHFDAYAPNITQDKKTGIGGWTDAQIAKATKPTERAGQDKGLTIASLGLLNQDWFWLSTPLVTTQTNGRVVVEKTGASVNLTLLPNGTPAGSGSQLSIAAMQALGVPITDLVPVRVFIQ